MVVSKTEEKSLEKNNDIFYLLYTGKSKRDKIELSAQKYLDKFYKDLGFYKIGEDYLEDGIPHQRMIKEIN